MQPSKVLSALERLVSVFGIMGTLVLVAMVLGAGIITLNILLHHGETGLRALADYSLAALRLLRYEPKRTSPAVRCELRFHQFFILAFFLSFGAVLIHAAIPWMKPDVERTLLAVGVSSFVIIILLTAVSIKLTARFR
jgi:hypothetical protein